LQDALTCQNGEAATGETVASAPTAAQQILEVDTNAGPRTLLNAPIRSLFRGVQAARPTSAGVEASAFVER